MLTYDTKYYKEIISDMIKKQNSNSITKASLDSIPSSVSLNIPSNTIQMIVFDIYGTLLHTRMGEIGILEKNPDMLLDIPELHLQLDIQKTQKDIQKLILEQHTILRTKYNIHYPEINIINIWKTYSHNNPLFPKTLNTEEAMICALRHEILINPVWAMPQAFHTLIQLQKQGYALGIISNAQFYTPLILEIIYPKWNTLEFETSIWSYQHHISKPSSTLYHRFLQKSKYEAKSILYIGNDKNKDIVPAKKVGMNPLLYAGDASSFRPHSPKLDKTEHTIIISLNDILKILQINS